MKKRAKNGSVPRAFDADFKSSYQKLQKQVKDLSQDFLAVVALLDRNTKTGYPMDADTGECYLCEKGVFTDEAWESDDGYDKLSVPHFHKPDCVWRQAREMLDPKKNAEALKDAEAGIDRIAAMGPRMEHEDGGLP